MDETDLEELQETLQEDYEVGCALPAEFGLCELAGARACRCSCCLPASKLSCCSRLWEA